MLWQLLISHNLVPLCGQIIHMLWTLYFLKQYPTQDAGCAAVGGSGGAVDPKTLQKYVYPFICAIAYLENYVVSISYCVQFLPLNYTLTKYCSGCIIFADFA